MKKRKNNFQKDWNKYSDAYDKAAKKFNRKVDKEVKKFEKKHPNFVKILTIGLVGVVFFPVTVVYVIGAVKEKKTNKKWATEKINL